MYKKILIIGPIVDKNPKSLGGATVLLNNFIVYLKEHQYSYIQIKTNQFGTGIISKILNLISLFFFLLKYINKIDVIFYNGSQKSVLFIYPLVVRIAIKYKKKIFLRIFGGNFNEFYEKVSNLSKNRFLTAINFSTAIFIETKFLVSYLEKIINDKEKLYWVTNTRKNVYKIAPTRSFSKKFVFISQVRKDKGIDEIIEAANLLSSEYVIDIYGPIIDTKYNEQVLKSRKNNLRYLGYLDTSDVITVLNQYDVLLLPTYYKGEGYPGIIIEAFSLGIPVITTKWKAIPEIVTDGENGILVNIQDVLALKNAISSINNELYKKLSYNVYETFSNNFDSEKINSIIIEKLTS